ncbi:MAG: hypothetical protein GJU73_03555 [Ferrovum sp.]|jgi:hypothetical protein|uniref:hypothetical protein n=1 Tax=Ferrovum sp. TaxID=2609467 RepID=UPI00262AC495|nr:hypothetical protein [Ferrovum sp.]MBW8066499.1 hypothetical protein [Ferrovum sp.]
MSNWSFDSPLRTLSDEEKVRRDEKLWEDDNLGGVHEDNNPVPAPVVWLVALTVVTAFAITFPLWGQRPTAALYEPYVNSMDKPEVLAAKDDKEAMAKIVEMNKGTPNDALLERHPLTMDDLRMIAPQIKALEAKGAHMHDFEVVGDQVVTANFEGNYRPDGSRIRQQPWWDKGYTIDVFYLSYFFLSVFTMIKRLPPTTWQPKHDH